MTTEWLTVVNVSRFLETLVNKGTVTDALPSHIRVRRPGQSRSAVPDDTEPLQSTRVRCGNRPSVSAARNCWRNAEARLK